MFFTRLPQRIPTRKCNRCGMQYQESESKCSYCAGKCNDKIIKDIHIPHSEQLEKASSTGRQCFYLAIIVGCFLLAFM